MQPSDGESQPGQAKTLVVGCQRLTQEQFLDAISAALLDKVRHHQSAEEEGNSPSLDKSIDPAD